VSGLALAALLLWVVLTMVSAWGWLPLAVRPAASWLRTVPGLVISIGVLALGTAAVGLLAGLAPPVEGRFRWLVTGVALAAATLAGGTVTKALLALADKSTRVPLSRVTKTVLPGGAWIGALERLTLVAVLLLGWRDGVAVIVAVKGLARFPELRTGQGTGAAERFIIGTFTSLGWAGVCAGIARAL
jgi:hypothetical protein